MCPSGSNVSPALLSDQYHILTHVSPTAAVLRASTDLLQTLPDRFLVHNAIHHCLRQLISSTIGDAFHSRENLIDGSAKPVGAAASQRDHQAVSEAQKQLLAENQIELEADLVVLLLSVSQRMFR